MESKLRRRLELWFWTGGIAVSAGVAVQAWLSRAFVYGEGHGARPIVPFVVVFLLTAVAYATAVFAGANSPAAITRRAKVALWGLALLPRLLFLGSNPIQEDDFYRYLWDGNAVLAGVNPYRYAPEELRSATPDEADAALARLARARVSSPDAERTFERVNHPHLSTVYPPVSAAVFAISQWLAPWSLTGLRLVLLTFDLGTMALLWRLLGRLGLPRRAWVAYAWCPLVALSIANTAHGDSIPVFFVTLCLAAALEARPLLAPAALACAALAKLYPLALAPLFFASLARSGRGRLVGGLAIFGLVAAAFIAAIGLPTTLGRSGFLAYMKYWDSNGGLFALVASMIGDGTARLLSALAVLGVVAIATARVRRAEGPEAIVGGFGVVLAAVFCLSPSQFPWYYVWVIPFLCFFPSAPWVLLSGLLGLYYVGFWIEYNLDPVSSATGDQVRRWLLLAEHLPFYVWLVADLLRRGSGSRPTPSPWAMRFWNPP